MTLLSFQMERSKNLSYLVGATLVIFNSDGQDETLKMPGTPEEAAPIIALLQDNAAMTEKMLKEKTDKLKANPDMIIEPDEASDYLFASTLIKTAMLEEVKNKKFALFDISGQKGAVTTVRDEVRYQCTSWFAMNRSGSFEKVKNATDARVYYKDAADYVEDILRAVKNTTRYIGGECYSPQKDIAKFSLEMNP